MDEVRKKKKPYEMFKIKHRVSERTELSGAEIFIGIHGRVNPLKMP